MIAYINLSTKTYPCHVGDIEIDPLGMANYAEVKWVPPPPVDETTERVIMQPPLNINGEWYANWKIEKILDPEQEQRIRNERNEELAQFSSSLYLKRLLKID